MKRPITIIIAFFFVIVLVIPSLIVLPFSGSVKSEAQVKTKEPSKAVSEAPKDPAVPVSVYRSSEEKVDNLQLRDYLVGVVASEMPADFNLEALKAQALAARTYIVKRLINKEDFSNLPDNAVVGDTVDYQVYKSPQNLKDIWGSDYSWKIKKVEKAVDETADQIITYKNQPITASFFSTSNGYTENAEDYWSNSIPYLKSVKSPWDKKSPKYETINQMPVSTVQEKLGVTLSTNDGPIGTNKKLTAGKRIASIDIGGTSFTGREIREKLDLRSSDFQLIRHGNTVEITTKGYGHGVGMSQYGANGLAAEGKTYKDIVKYYYKGVKVSKAAPLLNKVTAKK